jgi:formylglycine-generating enzyme required for sulfatase activity
MKNHPATIWVLAIAGVSVACTSTQSPGASGGSGGSASGGSSGAVTGGQSGTGGSGGSTAATGGSSTSTGGTGTGGSVATGGKPGTGGVSSAGGSGGGASGSGGAPPSCQSSGSGLSDCGPNGESCCTSPKVSGGTFNRTYTNDGTGATKTADPATISDFRLDKYLVTVGRFRKFVAAWDGGSGYTPDAGSGKHVHLNGGKGLADSGAAGSWESGWLDSYGNEIDLTNDTLQCDSRRATWTASSGDNEKLPMNCINWFEAYAFCIWDGGFLASEAEYVYAAAGGSEQRRFPWGATSPDKSNQYAIWNCSYPDGSGTCDGTIHNIAPVGTPKLGAGKWGQLDLVGNLIEWYLDWSAPAYGNPCTDCADLAGGSGRAPRDGYFTSTNESILQSSYRNNGLYPTNGSYSYGFRCARTP